jgi:hypothetical protein
MSDRLPSQPTHDQVNGHSPDDTLPDDGIPDEQRIVFDMHGDLSGMSQRQAVVAADPMLEELARQPYDPVVAARATGYLTGKAIAEPPSTPWMRAIAYVLATGLLVIGVYGLTTGLFDRGGSLGIRFAEVPRDLLTAGVFAVAGVLWLWRLVTRPPTPAPPLAAAEDDVEPDF